MRQFGAGELSALRATQERAMQDVCNILVQSDGDVDAYGKTEAAWTTSSTSVRCGFGPVRARELMALVQAGEIEAELRLPIDTQISALDRVEITTRYGETLTEVEVYEVIGPTLRGPSGVRVGIRTAVRK